MVEEGVSKSCGCSLNVDVVDTERRAACSKIRWRGSGEC